MSRGFGQYGKYHNLPWFMIFILSLYNHFDSTIYSCHRQVHIITIDMFMQRFTPPVLIDEIQYAPQILPYIKMSVDNSGRYGDFWLTDSQAFHYRVCLNITVLMSTLTCTGTLGIYPKSQTKRLSTTLWLSLRHGLQNQSSMKIWRRMLGSASQLPKSWCISLILGYVRNAGKEAPLYYYRDKEKRKIDLVLHEDGTLFPVEIKKSASPGTEAVKHFKALNPVTEPGRFGELEQYKTEIGNGAVICMANDLFPADMKNWFVPAWLI